MKSISAVLLIALLSTPSGESRAAEDFSSVRGLLAANVAAVNQISHAQAIQLSDMAALAHMPEYFRAPAAERKAKLPEIKSSLTGADMGSELCLIDGAGVEHLRVVNGQFASEKELSKEEMDAPFFGPGMALGVGQSYTSDPYLSPDVGEWVIGVVVPVIPGNAILHFEHPVKAYNDALRATADQGFVLAIDRAGHIVMDSRGSVTSKKADALVDPDDYFVSIRKGNAAMPADVVRQMFSGTPGEAHVTWQAADYLAAWQTVDGLIILCLQTLVH